MLEALLVYAAGTALIAWLVMLLLGAIFAVPVGFLAMWATLAIACLLQAVGMASLRSP